MTHISVIVRFLGAVVEERVVRLRDGMRIGDAVGAVVSFPHISLVICHDSLGWTVSGHRMVPGRHLVLSYGDFEVALEGVTELPARRSADHSPDIRLLVATLALMLSAAWLDTMGRVLDHNPELARGIQALLVAPEPVAGVALAGVGDAEPAWDRAGDWPPAERSVRVELRSVSED